MKSLINRLVIAVVGTFFSFSAMASYDPYTFKCVYSAGVDGLMEVNSTVSPDDDEFSFSWTSLDTGHSSIHEFSSVTVLDRKESRSSEDSDTIKQLATKLKIDTKSWYSTTRLEYGSAPDSRDGDWKMVYYKFNSENGTLGIGIRTTFSIYDTLTECVE